jgi:hypothetical protein
MLREEKLAWLQAEIQKGIDSGPGIPGDEVFARLEARAQARKVERERKTADVARVKTNEAA